jgi:hypothetical protein
MWLGRGLDLVSHLGCWRLQRRGDEVRSGHVVVPELRAAQLIGSWAREPQVLGRLIEVYGALYGELQRPPTRRDIELLQTRLEQAVSKGRLVITCPLAPVPIPHREIEFEPAEPAPPQERPPAKSFVDVVVLDSNGNPLPGRRYKLQTPNGLTEEGRLDANARLYKGRVDPGTAWLTILPDKEQIIRADDVGARHY